MQQTRCAADVAAGQELGFVIKATSGVLHMVGFSLSFDGASMPTSFVDVNHPFASFGTAGSS